MFRVEGTVCLWLKGQTVYGKRDRLFRVKGTVYLGLKGQSVQG